MHYNIIITVRADADPSCNRYTLTQEFDRSRAAYPFEPPPIEFIKQACTEVIINHRESWPHKGIAYSGPFVEAKIVAVERTD